MVDFIDEVNEELRRERLASFWQKAGGYIIGASLAIVAGTVASVVWQNYQESRQLDAAENYFSADKNMKSHHWTAAAERFDEVAKKDAKGFTALANLQRAHALNKADNQEEAVKQYRALVNDLKADAGLRELARIYAAQIMINRNATFEDVNNLLQPLVAKKENPFSAFAQEQLALAALQNGDQATAERLLAETAKNEKNPATLRRRAQAQLASIQPHEKAPDEKTPDMKAIGNINE